MMRSEDISDEELLFIVGQTDARLFAEGMEMRQRSFDVPIAVMRQFGYTDVVLAGLGRAPLLDRIENAYGQIYRQHDLAMGGHIGVFMFRDVFVRIAVPMVYGNCSLNPFDYVELTPVQRRILQFEKGDMKCVDQFLDVLDIQYGIEELKSQFATQNDLIAFLQNARFHLHGAAAVLTGGYDHRGAVQSSLLATELVLKAGAVASGLSRNEIKARFGHQTPKILGCVADRFPAIDRERIRRVLAKQPPYVGNRYSLEQPKRWEAGELAMGAQFVVSEVVRQLSNRNIRASNSGPPSRVYPI